MFILGIFYFSLYSSILWMLLFIRNYNEIFKDPMPKRLPRITVIIPAYNEEENIAKSIDSCINLDYPSNKLDILVVNDGSTDKTKEICKTYVKRNLIGLISKKNGGKASAMNAGLKHTKTEFIAYLDADSEYDQKALKNMIGYLEDKNVGAVTSSMKPNKHSTFIERLQWVEYLFSIYMRKIFDFARAQYVIPGPGSVYRKKAILDCGGFDENNLTEDMEIAFKMHTTRYIIKNSTNAHVTTDVPGKFRDFLKQRLRWYVGYFDNVQKFRFMIFNRKFGTLGTFLIPSNFIWLLSILFLTGYWLYKFLEGAYHLIENMFLINWDIASIMNWPSLTLLFYSLNLVSLLGAMLFVVFLLVILLSIYTSSEKIDIKRKLPHYTIFLITYVPVMAIVWGASVLYKLFVWERSGWQ